jgi:hypothetical protein
MKTVSVSCDNCGAAQEVRPGTTGYRCPFCNHPFLVPAMAASDVPPAPAGIVDTQSRGRALLGVGAIVSVLVFVGVGVAALIVYPKWESELLMWIALFGAPGTLAAILWPIYKALLRRSAD